MSDDEEYEYDYGSDDYDQDDEEGGNEVEDELIEIENSFYEGEDLIKDNPEGACELFNTMRTSSSVISDVQLSHSSASAALRPSSCCWMWAHSRIG